MMIEIAISEPQFASYAVALICEEIDQWQHNRLFVNELIPAFMMKGIKLKTLDYRKQPREVREALNDQSCEFFVCFNGFGSELQVSNGQPGRFRSVYEYFQKPLYDFMHDCPAHESMEHQRQATYRRRFLFLTDYGYVAIAKALGVRHARFVPSIAFPSTIGLSPKPLLERTIEILLPMGFQDPNVSRLRHVEGTNKRTIYRKIFETVIDMCICNLHLDPLHELAALCLDVGIEFDFNDPDSCFLLTTVLDYVKFERRNRLIRAIAHLPVTIMSRTPFEELMPESRLRSIETRSAAEMMAVMAESRSVICPLPHMTGYHERALGAFTAGAAVFAAPNHILESEFTPGKDLWIYKTEAQLVALLEGITPDYVNLQEIAANGHRRALAQCSPNGFVERVISHLRLEKADPQYGG